MLKTINRELPKWEAPRHVKKMAEDLRRYSETHPNPCCARDYELLVRESNVDRERALLHAHLDEAQLEAVITGDAFSVGKLLVRSCVYTSGRIVHLQLHSRCAGAPTFQPKRYGDGSGFAQEPVCGQGGTYLEKFDDEYYEQLATTDKIRRCVFLTGRTLSGPEMLTFVCRDCARRAKLLSNRN